MHSSVQIAREEALAVVWGKRGERGKRIGTEARRDIEKMLNKKVFLETPIKVKKNWRNDNRELKKFGYES